MNLNNFVVLPSKPKSMKLNVRNLRELRMEKVQLDQQTKDMESKLEELRERMSQEKEEREKTGRSHWRSAQPGVLAPVFHDAKTNKENATRRLSPGKMKIRVLKDEPLPGVQKQTVTEPAVKTQGTNRKLRLKGKVCGQCEVQLAGLMCSECGEDYCVGCFVRFHQKGALQRHRMIPIQAQLQTPVTTRDVLGRVQRQVRLGQSQRTHDTVPKSADEGETAEDSNTQPVSDDQTQHTHPQVLFVNDGVDTEDDEAAEEDDSSLLRGNFDEEESARSFQEALKEWREKGRTGDAFRRPVSAMETQTEKRHQRLIRLEFKEDTLSYMEKLLLKQSRRGQIEQFHPLSDARLRPDPTTPPPTETDELSEKLTAEQMELRMYFASLFTIAPAEDAGKPNGPEESCISITELDEMDTDAATHTSFAVKEENESKMFTSIGDLSVPIQNREEFGRSIVTFTPSLSQMTRGSERSQSQETDQFLSALSKSGSSPLLRTSLQGSHGLTAVAASSESILNVPRQSQNDELPTRLCDSPKPKLWTRSFISHQNKFSNPVPPSSSLSPRTELNASLPDCDSDVIFSPGSPPSAHSSPCQLSPKPPDSQSSRSRLSSSPVKPMNSRLDHSTSHAVQKLTHPTAGHVISSSCTASSSRLSSRRASPALSVHDSIRPPVQEICSHTGNNSSPPSRWLKSGRRSPKTTMLSLQLSLSDSEEDVTGDDVCLLPSEEDSSDEELRCINDSEVKRNTASSVCPTVTPSSDSLFAFQLLSERENTEPGLLTESSQALHSIAQRQDIQRGHDGGLEGFFTLGLETADVQLSSTPAQTSRETQNSTECSLAVVQDFWRPSSSLRQEEIVDVLLNSQLITRPLHPATPRQGTMSSQRHPQEISSRCSWSSSRVQSASTHRPGSSVHTLSRAAQEILEVQTVERPEAHNSDEDEEDCLALACLEEEFRNMSSVSYDEDGHVSQMS